MKSVRKGVFETNSSSEHSVTISFDGYTYLDKENCSESYIYLDNYDIEWILNSLPTELLEKELKNRKHEETD